MEDRTTPIEVLLERARAYTNTSIRLFKLQAISKIAGIFSSLASGFVLFIVFFFLFVNLNIAIALLIGDLLGKIWLGFFLLSGFYALVGIVLYLLRDKWIKQPVSDRLITQLLKEQPADNTRPKD